MRTKSFSGIHKQFQNSCSHPKRLSSVGGKPVVGFGKTIGGLSSADEPTDLFRVNRLTAGAPTALRDLDDYAVKTHQVRRRNPNPLSLQYRAIVTEHLNKCPSYCRLHRIAPRLTEERSRYYRLDDLEPFFRMLSEGNTAGTAIVFLDLIEHKSRCSSADFRHWIDLLADKGLHQ